MRWHRRRHINLDAVRRGEEIHRAIEEGRDVHADTAAALGVDRGRAKTINYATIYAQSRPSLMPPRDRWWQRVLDWWANLEGWRIWR